MEKINNRFFGRGKCFPSSFHLRVYPGTFRFTGDVPQRKTKKVIIYVLAIHPLDRLHGCVLGVISPCSSFVAPDCTHDTTKRKNWNEDRRKLKGKRKM